MICCDRCRVPLTDPERTEVYAVEPKMRSKVSATWDLCQWCFMLLRNLLAEPALAAEQAGRIDPNE